MATRQFIMYLVLLVGEVSRANHSECNDTSCLQFAQYVAPTTEEHSFTFTAPWRYAQEFALSMHGVIEQPQLVLTLEERQLDL